jgi:hypoxanthine-guanine phosphoribosyltransferase
MFGFEIDDEWVVGYGMDNDKGYMRNYPSIWSL